MTHNLLAKRRLCSWRPGREAKSLATYYVRSCQRMYGLASVLDADWHALLHRQLYNSLQHYNKYQKEIAAIEPA